MPKPRIVTPEEAQEAARGEIVLTRGHYFALARTVASEPDRIRAAVVEALRNAAVMQMTALSLREWADAIEDGKTYDPPHANAIENGPDYA